MVGLFKIAGSAILQGAGETAAFIAEELGFEKVFRDGGAVDFNEGFIPSAAELVQDVGDDILSSTSFPSDENG